MEIEVHFRRVRPASDLPPPSCATPGSAGADLAADIREPVSIPPGGIAQIPTGIAIELPEGFEAQVRPRSGLAARHGVTVLNAPGTIDSDFRGEIQVLLINHGEKPHRIARGERIAQLVVAPVIRARWVQAVGLADTPRGSGGFGSTGR